MDLLISAPEFEIYTFPHVLLGSVPPMLPAVPNPILVSGSPTHGSLLRAISPSRAFAPTAELSR